MGDMICVDKCVYYFRFHKNSCRRDGFPWHLKSLNIKYKFPSNVQSACPEHADPQSLGCIFCFVFLICSVPVMHMSVKIVFIPQGFIKLHFFYWSFAVMFGNMSDLTPLTSGFSGGGAQVNRVRNSYLFNFGIIVKVCFRYPHYKSCFCCMVLSTVFFFFFFDLQCLLHWLWAMHRLPGLPQARVV